MSGRIFGIPISAVAVTAAVDLWELTAADDRSLEIMGIELGQTSDSGDAQDEQLRVSIVRGNTTSGSGGSAPTPTPMDSNSSAAGFSAETCNTTAASSGTAVTLGEFVWNVRAGYIQWFPENCRPKTNQTAGLLCLRQTAPADSLTVSGTLWVREL